MKALFVELPAFSQHRMKYLDDEGHRCLQLAMMRNPNWGRLIQGTGGLRKLRYGDARRGKGKRGGLRIIYFWWEVKCQFWLFTIYDKNEMNDLSPDDKRALQKMLAQELEARQ